MKRLQIVVFLLYSTVSGYAVLPEAPDAKSLSMGRVRALSETALNPSSLSFLEKGAAGFTVMNHYQIAELNTFSAFGMFPNKYLDAAVRLSQFGFEDYREWAAQAGVSKRLLPMLSVGASIHYQCVTGVYDEDVPSVTGVDLGVTLRLMPDLRCALLYESLATNADKIRGLFSSGLDYRVAPSCHLLAEYATDFGDITRLSFGIDYELMDSFYIRTGCYTQDFTPTFGLSFTWNRFTADVACDRHAHLGYSTSLGLSCQF